MSSTLSPNPSQPYVPKLAFRNAAFEPPGPPSDETRTISTSTSVQTPSSTPLSAPPTIASSNTSLSSPSASYFSLPPSQHSKSAKKKSSSILGNFFKVKEPSTQALADYQKEQTRRAAAAAAASAADRNKRTPVPVQLGVSSAKLPLTVPKVNTKWDGVPKALKDKERAASNRPIDAPGARPLSFVFPPGPASQQLQGSTSTVSTHSSIGGGLTPASTDSSRSHGPSQSIALRPATRSGLGSKEGETSTRHSNLPSLTSPSTNSLPEFVTVAETAFAGATSEQDPSVAVASNRHAPLTPSSLPRSRGPSPAPSTNRRSFLFFTKANTSEPSTPLMPSPTIPPLYHDGVTAPPPKANVLGPSTPASRLPAELPFLAGEAAPLKTPPDESRNTDESAALWRASSQPNTVSYASNPSSRAESTLPGLAVTSPSTLSVPSTSHEVDRSKTLAERRGRSIRDRSITPWDFDSGPQTGQDPAFISVSGTGRSRRPKFWNPGN